MTDLNLMQTIAAILSLIAQSGLVRCLADICIVVFIVSFLALVVWARRAPYQNGTDGGRSATKWL